eukprot:Skav207643  [mRNA]  locus=scaffold1172:326246:327342:+ [translate_table: standard]
MSLQRWPQCSHLRQDVEIREEAIRALGKVANDHRALNCIIRGLRDESIYVRQAALEVMP